MRVMATRLANIRDERPASLRRDAEPSAAVLEIAPAQEARSRGVVPPVRRLRGSRMEFIAIGGDNDRKPRMRVECDDRETH